MIYFHFLARQTGKTTKVIEIFNRDVDNMLMVHDSSTKQHLKDKILREALIDPKHNYLLDRKIKLINESVVGYRCKTLIIDEPLDSNLDFDSESKNTSSFRFLLHNLSRSIKNDVIILQSIENEDLLKYVEITRRVNLIYKLRNSENNLTRKEHKELLNNILEEVYHQVVMIDVLSEEETKNELLPLEDFKDKIKKLIKIIPGHDKYEIITNKLPE
jgi:hypothetical protein